MFRGFGIKNFLFQFCDVRKIGKWRRRPPGTPCKYLYSRWEVLPHGGDFRVKRGTTPVYVGNRRFRLLGNAKLRIRLLLSIGSKKLVGKRPPAAQAKPRGEGFQGVWAPNMRVPTAPKHFKTPESRETPVSRPNFKLPGCALRTPMGDPSRHKAPESRDTSVAMLNLKGPRRAKAPGSRETRVAGPIPWYPRPPWDPQNGQRSLKSEGTIQKPGT